MRQQTAASSAALLDRHEDDRAVQPVATSSHSVQDVLGWSSLVTRVIGAVAVLVVGVIHLQAHSGPYSAVETIGELFLLNFAAAVLIGGMLLLPLEHLVRRWGTAAVVLTTIAGIGLAGVSLVMLIVAEHGTVFGFHEPGYDPEAISRSRISEIAAIGLLGTSLMLRRLARATPRW